MKKALCILAISFLMFTTAATVQVSAAVKCLVDANGDCIIPTPPPPPDTCNFVGITIGATLSCQFDTTSDQDILLLQSAFPGKYKITTTLTTGTAQIWVTTSSGTLIMSTRNFTNSNFEVELQANTYYRIYVLGSNTSYTVKVSLVKAYEVDMAYTFFTQQQYAVAEWEYDYSQLINTSLSIHDYIYQFGYTTMPMFPMVIVDGYPYQTFKTQIIAYDPHVYHEVQLILSFFQSYLYDLEAYYDDMSDASLESILEEYLYPKIEEMIQTVSGSQYNYIDFMITYLSLTTAEARQQFLLDAVLDYAVDGGCSALGEIPKVGNLLSSVCNVTADKIVDFGGLTAVLTYLETHSFMEFISEDSEIIADIFIQAAVETYIFSTPQYQILDIISKLLMAYVYSFHSSECEEIADNLNNVITMFDPEEYGNIRIDYTTGYAGDLITYYNSGDDLESLHNLFNYYWISDIVFSKTFVNVVSQDWYASHPLFLGSPYTVIGRGNVRALTLDQFADEFRANFTETYGWTPPNMIGADEIEVYWGTEFVEYNWWDYPSA